MKISSKELRIGNLLMYYEETLPVSSIGGDETITFQKGKDIIGCFRLEYIKPIPLTEDWLLKFGYTFEGVVIHNQYESYKRYQIYNFVGDDSHEVHIINSTYGGTNDTEYTTSVGQFDRQYNGRMDYVHDLQNAVYKEMGKELEIK